MFQRTGYFRQIENSMYRGEKGQFMILGENNRLTAEATEELAKYADLIDCECPTHLLSILAKVREFSVYTASCIERFPKDAKTHRWLLQASENIDLKLSTTIAQLARMEGFINDENQLVPRSQVEKKAQ